MAHEDADQRDPFKGILELVAWVKTLNDDFDQLVVSEKKAQLERTLDRLGKSLYAYELDIAYFRDQIPEKKPDEHTKEILWNIENKSKATLDDLGEAVRDVGADVRLNDGAEVERTLTYGLHYRGVYLDHVEKVLTYGPWNAEDVRDSLDKGLKAIHDAQMAVTEFEKKLSATKADTKKPEGKSGSKR